jgi:transglutaminase-like putative cysteine protease
LDKVHALMSAIHNRMDVDGSDPQSAMGADKAFASGRAANADFAHLFVALARCAEIPARFIRGYLLRQTMTQAATAHAWAEAHISGLGWVGFDPVQGCCPDDNYVRVAVGLDSLGAAPVRGRRRGGGSESMKVAVDVALAWPFMRENQ